MGRYVSPITEITSYYGIRDVNPNFGTGNFRYFGASGSFKVPAGITSVRVHALGGGGGGGGFSCQCCCFYVGGGGGGGGGYVVATVPVTPGTTCTVTVGAAGTHYGDIGFTPSFCSGCCVNYTCGAGGTTQFGTAVCATGGGGGCMCWMLNPSASCVAGGCAGCYVISSGTLVVGSCGNRGCNGCSGCDGLQHCGSPGGASGSPLGGGSTGPWPGTSSSDVFGCRSFAGGTESETEVAAKFLNIVRWPGEVLMSTSRTQSVINGVAAIAALCGVCNCCCCCWVTSCYCVGAYGGACPAPVCIVGNPCSWNPSYIYTGGAATTKAGTGGGGAGGIRATYLGSGGYSPCSYGSRWHGGAPGSGFLVVEF